MSYEIHEELKKKIKGKTSPLYLKESRFLLETQVKSNTQRRSVRLLVALESNILSCCNGTKLPAAAPAEPVCPSRLPCS